MIKLIIETNRANEETIKALIEIGALYVDENGVHASAPGVYSKK